MAKRASLRVLTITLTLTLFALVALEGRAESPENYHYCEISSPEVGSLKFRGHTMDQAMMRVAQACVERQKAHYQQLRGESLPPDRAEIFIESCVNKVHCTRS